MVCAAYLTNSLYVDPYSDGFYYLVPISPIHHFIIVTTRFYRITDPLILLSLNNRSKMLKSKFIII